MIVIRVTILIYRYKNGAGLKGKTNGFKDILKNWGKRDRKVKSDLWETLRTSIKNYETRLLDINVREGAVYYGYKL